MVVMIEKSINEMNFKILKKKLKNITKRVDILKIFVILVFIRLRNQPHVLYQFKNGSYEIQSMKPRERWRHDKMWRHIYRGLAHTDFALIQ